MPAILVIGLIVVANLAYGAQGGIASLVGFGRPATWLLTLFAIGLCLIIAGRMINGRIDGVFIDQRNKISLSRLQLVLWSTLLISALLTAGLSNVSLDSLTPLQIKIPPSVWALLGIGSFTFAAAPTILQRKESGPVPARLKQIRAALATKDNIAAEAIGTRGSVIIKKNVADARWLDILRGDEGDADTVDVSKVQQLAFTGLLLCVYGGGVMNALAGTLPVTALASVDEGFVTLLGLSHAAYLAFKAMPKTN